MRVRISCPKDQNCSVDVRVSSPRSTRLRYSRTIFHAASSRGANSAGGSADGCGSMTPGTLLQRRSNTRTNACSKRNPNPTQPSQPRSYNHNAPVAPKMSTGIAAKNPKSQKRHPLNPLNFGLTIAECEFSLVSRFFIPHSEIRIPQHLHPFCQLLFVKPFHLFCPGQVAVKDFLIIEAERTAKRVGRGPGIQPGNGATKARNNLQQTARALTQEQTGTERPGQLKKRLDLQRLAIDGCYGV